jgi:hypothetical protein
MGLDKYQSESLRRRDIKRYLKHKKKEPQPQNKQRMMKLEARVKKLRAALEKVLTIKELSDEAKKIIQTALKE